MALSAANPVGVFGPSVNDPIKPAVGLSPDSR